MAFIDRKFPVVPDDHDERDKVFTAAPLPSGILQTLLKIVRPERRDYREKLGPIKDQGPLGACTGFTFSEIREFLNRKYFNQESAKDVSRREVFSPLYIYYKEREMEGDIEEDGGAQMRTGCQVLQKFGVCREKEHPYNPRDFKKQPDPSDDIEAAEFRVAAYHRLRTLEDMKNCLRHGYVFAIGFRVFESFYNVGKDGKMPMPAHGERELGGHAVMCVGFDDKMQCLIIRNSWGADWGDKGCFYMPYAFASSSFYLFDAWAVTLDPAAFEEETA